MLPPGFRIRHVVGTARMVAPGLSRQTCLIPLIPAGSGHAGTNMTSRQTAAATIQDLLEIMRRLRDPEDGCPWDLEQDFGSIAPYTLEEAYEVVDAIERDARGELCSELGDLLFQVVYHAQMARESGWFDFDQVVGAICEKLIRRHPHVFGDEVITDAAAQSIAWDAHKQAEKAARSRSAGVLADVPVALPAVARALKLQKRARAGFDWRDIRGVMAKVREELDEVGSVMEGRGAREELAAEIGDLLFSCINLARHAGIEPESALRATNDRFQRRFQFMEERLSATGRSISDASPEELEVLWEEAKRLAG
jgi:ATP diphosphatase